MTKVFQNSEINSNPLKITQYHTVCTPGSSWAKVVDNEIGGTTAQDFHCLKSCPAWIASVAKWGKGVKSLSELIFKESMDQTS